MSHKANKNSKNSSYFLVFGRWPQTKTVMRNSCSKITQPVNNAVMSTDIVRLQQRHCIIILHVLLTNIFVIVSPYTMTVVSLGIIKANNMLDCTTSEKWKSLR